MQEKFMFYSNFLKAIEQLDEDDKANACLALCRYGITGELPENPIFKMFCIGVSVSVQKYDGRGGKREGAGRKSNKNNDLDENQKNQNNPNNQNNQKNHNAQTETETETETINLKKEISKENVENTKGCRFENSPYFNETLPKEFETESSKMNPFQSAEREYQTFKDYWVGKTGATATKKDWIATWRNWLRNSRTFKDISHVLNREAVKNQIAYLEQMKAQGDEFFIQRARTRLKQIIEQELEK